MTAYYKNFLDTGEWFKYNYRYNALGQIEKVIRRDSRGNHFPPVRYSYDAGGWRVKKRFYERGGFSEGVEINYLRDLGGEVIYLSRLYENRFQKGAAVKMAPVVGEGEKVGEEY
jgi:hypothetical protein